MSWARALHAFASDPNDATQMSLVAGEELSEVMEVGNGWSEGTNKAGTKGVFPSSYIEAIAAHPPAPPAPPAAPTPAPPPPAAVQPPPPAAAQPPPAASPKPQPSPPVPPPPARLPSSTDAASSEGASVAAPGPDQDSKLVGEIELSVREWRKKLMEALKESDFAGYNRIKNQVATLLEWRRQLLVLDKESNQRAWVKAQAIHLIEARRQMDEAFTVPRHADGGMATTENSTISDLHEKHKDMAQRMLDGSNLPASVYEQYRAEEKGGLRQRRADVDGDEGFEPGSGGGASANLFCNVKAAIFSSPDPVQLLFSLWVRSEPDPSQSFGRRGRSPSVGTPESTAVSRISVSGDGSVGEGVDMAGGFKQISEEFLVGMTNKGFPEDPSLFDVLNTVFADTPRALVRDHLFLVCRVYRMGTLNPDPKAKKNLAAGAKSIGAIKDSEVIFRRPFGCGVMDLANADVHQFEHGKEVEATMTLFKTPNSEGYGFPDLHFQLMRNGGRAQEGAAEIIPQCTGVVVGLGMFDGHIEGLLAHETVRPFDEKKTLQITRRAMDKKMEVGRNDLYITLIKGTFSQDGKKSAKNVEVKMSILDDQGTEIPCLINGTGRQSVQKYGTYRSTVYYHQNTPTFMETVKMTIPEGDVFERAHVHFLVSHCKDDVKTPRVTKDGSFAFLPLAAPGIGVALPDGEHVLTGYKLLPGMDKGTALPTYLQMDPSKLVEHKVKNILNGSAESEALTVYVRLVSTKKTQIAELHALVNWRSISDVKVLAATFDKLIRQKWSDLVKMLRELIDALIALLRDDSCKIPDKVYYFLAHVLNEASKPHNKAAYSLIEEHISKLTHQALGDLHAILVRHIRRHLTWVCTKPEPPPDPAQTLVMGLANTLNSIHLLVKIVKVSYNAAEAAGSGKGGGGVFLDDVGTMLDQVTGFFDLSRPVWVKTSQSKALRRLAPTLEHLNGFLPKELIAAKVFKLMAKLSVLAPGGGESSEPQLLDKLLLLRHVVRGYLFQDPAGRAILIPMLVDLLGGHLRSTGAPRHLAISVLNDCFNVVQRDQTTHPSDFQDAVQQLSGLMSELLSAVDSALDDEDVSGEGASSSKAMKALEEAMKRDAESRECIGDSGSGSLAAIKPISDAATALLTLVHLQGCCGDATVMDMNVAHLRGLLSAMGQLMTVQVFPADWLVMTMLQYQVTLQILEFAAGQLNAAGFLGVQDIRASTADGLLSPNECDALFFVVGLTLLREESLDMASLTMSPARKHFIVEVGKYGDLRAKVVEVLQMRWANVDLERRGQVEMMDLMVKPLLELVSSSSESVAETAKNMFFELLQAEFTATKNFLTIGRHAVDAIDTIMQRLNKQSASSSGDASSSASSDAVADPALLVMFRDELPKKFAADAALNTPDAMRFLQETTELFGLLRDLSRYPKTADYEDERVYAYTKLMEFLGRLERHDASIKYAHALSKELSALGLYSEAACALLLHAKLLQCDTPPDSEEANQEALAKGVWVSVAQQLASAVGCQVGCHGDCQGPGGLTKGGQPVMLEDNEMFPKQTAVQRREKIYEQAMDLFERGQQWEMALELADALKRQWSSVTMDYRKLSQLLKRSAEWYESILDAERYYPSIFRVAYYGNKFPLPLRNAEFVYRGAPLEQIIDFSSRVRIKFPGSVLLDLKAAIGPEHTDQSETYFLSISKLACCTRPELTALPPAPHVGDPSLPSGLRLWRQNNCLDTFSYRRPYNKRKMEGNKKSANSTVYFASEGKERALDTDGEFRDLWVEFKYVRTQRLFPSTQRRVLVVEQASVFRNPIEMAIESMEGKNAELETKIKMMETLPNGGADQSYTMALNGVVDAAVNGGLANYVSFLNGEYRNINPEIAEDVDSFEAKKDCSQVLSALVEQQIELMDKGIKVHSLKVCEAMKPLGQHMEGNYQKMRKDALYWAGDQKK